MNVNPMAFTMPSHPSGMKGSKEACQSPRPSIRWIPKVTKCQNDNFRDRDEVPDLPRLRGAPEIDVGEDQGHEDSQELLGGEESPLGEGESNLQETWLK